MRSAWHRVLIVLLLAGSAPAQGDEPPSPKTEIDALIVDAGGQPVADARVWVMFSETAESRSDAAGRAKISLNENHSGGMVLATAGDRLGVAQFRPARRQGKPIAARIELGQTRRFAVTVHDADGQPVAGAHIGTFFSHGAVTRLELPVIDSGPDGKAMLRVPAGARFVAAAASSADGLAGGLAESASGDAATVTLAPLTTVDGQLAGPMGEQYAGHDVIASVLLGEGDSQQLWWKWFSAAGTTDREGKFQLAAVATGTYQLKHRAPQGGAWEPLETVKIAGAAPVDLGKIVLERPSQRLRREVRIAMLCQGEPAEKYATAQARAKQDRQYVAVWLVDPQAAVTLDMLAALNSMKKLRRSTDNYQVVFLDARSEPAQRLARSLDVDLAPPKQWPQIVLLDLDGHQIADAKLPDFLVAGEIDPTRLLDFLRLHGPEPLDAQALLSTALAEARQSGRRVLVQETATWCGPCHALSKYLDEHRAIWEQDYLWVRIDHRWKNSEEVIDHLRTDNTVGIPWLAILDGEGRVLATHLGYPRTPELADAFLKKIDQTRQHLTDDDLVKLRAGLSEK